MSRWVNLDYVFTIYRCSTQKNIYLVHKVQSNTAKLIIGNLGNIYCHRIDFLKALNLYTIRDKRVLYFNIIGLQQPTFVITLSWILKLTTVIIMKRGYHRYYLHHHHFCYCHNYYHHYCYRYHHYYHHNYYYCHGYYHYYHSHSYKNISIVYG